MPQTLSLEEFDERYGQPAATPLVLTLEEFEAREAAPPLPRRKPLGLPEPETVVATKPTVDFQEGGQPRTLTIAQFEARDSLQNQAARFRETLKGGVPYLAKPVGDMSPEEAGYRGFGANLVGGAAGLGADVLKTLDVAPETVEALEQTRRGTEVLGTWLDVRFQW